MSMAPELNPAEIAAEEALGELFRCLDAGKSFRFEAGAGAGKTYSLIKGLEHLIARNGETFRRASQRIACVTFTNVAKEEIETRTGRHPAVYSDTIHGFCWTAIRGFQQHLRNLLSGLEDWAQLIDEVGGVDDRAVIYEFGFRAVSDHEVSLHHDDVPKLAAVLLREPKFRHIIASRFPVILIDEYQDTNRDFIQAIIDNVLDSGRGPLLGFFGDHWQRIYDSSSYGLIAHPSLVEIGKRANFRSSPKIVNCLNRMRPALPQMVKDPGAAGEVRILHTNTWRGVRRTGPHWGGDLPETKAHDYFSLALQRLTAAGWKLEAPDGAILMLTHTLLANEQGYPSIPGIFSSNDAFVKKEDAYIAFLIDELEPACAAFEERRYGEMFRALGRTIPPMRSPADKTRWSEVMFRLRELRELSNVGEVLDACSNSGVLSLPAAVKKREAQRLGWKAEAGEEEPSAVRRARLLREVQYREIVALRHFVEGQTPFSTKHGVKGAEFDCVLGVFGRGWNRYDFDRMLAWAGPGGVPAEKAASFERSRNLFYVVCSRPKTRLALLFTHLLSEEALATLATWFGDESIEALPDLA